MRHTALVHTNSVPRSLESSRTSPSLFRSILSLLIPQTPPPRKKPSSCRRYSSDAYYPQWIYSYYEYLFLWFQLFCLTMILTDLFIQYDTLVFIILSKPVRAFVRFLPGTYFFSSLSILIPFKHIVSWGCVRKASRASRLIQNLHCCVED
jgi:hypothetical protein